MPADTEPEYAQTRSRTVNVSGAARLAGRTTPRTLHRPIRRKAQAVKATRRATTVNLYIPQDDGTVLIEMPRPRPYPLAVVIIDAADEALVREYSWRARMNGSEHHWYACSSVSRTVRPHMHRLLCDGDMIDHVNGNTLDNRRSNLRAVTHVQNNANKRSGGGASQYKGVFRSGSVSNPWMAKIGVNYRRVHLGMFPTEEDAARAYDNAARDLWGEYACLNFPEPGERGAVDERAA
jgi:hypothetical protein